MEHFFRKYSDILDNNCVLSSNGRCMIWTGPVTHTGKYGVVRYRHPDTGVWKTVTAHRCRVMITTRDLNLNSNLDASHLCHNNLCVMINHISMEPHSTNNNRIHCKHSNKCTGHGEYPDCLLDLHIQVHYLKYIYTNLSFTHIQSNIEHGSSSAHHMHIYTDIFFQFLFLLYFFNVLIIYSVV